MGSRILTRSGTPPSYAAGYARSPAESANPGLWDSLVGAWVPALGVTGETLRDASGRGNHGTLTNMDPATDWVPTEKGYALDLNQASSYVNCGDITVVGELTMMVLVRMDSVTGYQELLTKRAESASTTDYGLDLSGDDIRFYYYNAGWSVWETTTASLDIGRWYCIVATHDNANDASIFVDGILVTSPGSSTGARIANNMDLEIGAYGGGQGPVNGQIAAVEIWNRILPVNEIRQLHADHLAPFRLAPLYISTPAAVTKRLVSVPQAQVSPSFASGFAHR